MDSRQLIAAGLTAPQAQAYAQVLEIGTVTPPQIAKKLGLTRSNAYKVLDKLAELELVEKREVNKKFTYTPNNPLALTNLVAEQRNIAASREQAVNSLMSELLNTYHVHTDRPYVKVVTGREAVAEAYRNQVKLGSDIYFIRSQLDIPVMSFDTMHEIRTMPKYLGNKRFGITPDIKKGPVNPKADKRSSLERTWIKSEDYTAPVEWSISGSTLLIVVFGSEPHAVTISSPAIAEAFKQLWLILRNSLRAMPYYKDLPRTSSPQ